MRPTRWTRRKRRTKFGKGGWGFSISVLLFHYTHPVTGDGYSSDRLYKLLQMRRTREALRSQKNHPVKGVTWEP